MRHFPGLASIAISLVALWASPARADLTIGVSMPLTGPSSALGLAVQNQMKLWPVSIADEKLRVILLDDATDPTQGVKNARRFTTEDKADVVFGSASVPVAIAMSDVLAEAGTVQLAAVPSVLPPGKDKWHFRLAQSSPVMARGLFAHMKKQGVKTVGFIGYSTAYGESWVKELDDHASEYGLKVVGVERFAMTDTGVTAQVLKLTSLRPDAILVVAAGSGAAMPHRALVERGYTGLIYQTHAAASRDLMRVGGKAVEGAFLVSGPAVVAEQLPATHPSKQQAMDFVTRYEAAYGAGSRNQYAAHGHDAVLVLQKAVPIALKRAKPGTAEFRAALRDALETMGPIALAHGSLQWTATDHWGFSSDTPVMLKVVAGNWQLQ